MRSRIKIVNHQRYHAIDAAGKNSELMIEVLLDIRDLLLKQQQEVDVAGGPDWMKSEDCDRYSPGGES